MKNILFALIVFTKVCCAQDTIIISRHFQHDKSPAKNLYKTIADSVFVIEPDDSVSTMLLHKTFSNNIYFDSITFLKPVVFCGSIFRKDAVFLKTSFKDFSDFSGVSFKKDITFSYCKFNKFLFMSEITADSVAVFNFYRAMLPDLIDFSHNKTLGRVVDFTNSNLDSVKRQRKGFSLFGISAFGFSDNRIFINIYNSHIDKLKLDYIHFRLCFYDPAQQDTLTDFLDRLVTLNKKRYSKTLINQKRIDSVTYQNFVESRQYQEYIHLIFPSASLKDTLIQNFTAFYFLNRKFPARLSEDQTEALYARLLKNFETNGQKMSYEAADVDRNNFMSGGWSVSRYWNQYGYHKEWIFYWTALFLIILTAATYTLGHVLFTPNEENENVYDVDKMPVLNKPSNFPRLRKLKYAFIYTSIIFFAFSLKTENLNFKRIAFVYIVFVNVVGLLCLGYLANFILQK